ncbi:MAG: NAD(P)/FAD-dependent oxidoreductase [Variovorax sp.]
MNASRFQEPPQEVSVLIVGAGPAGLAAARVLVDVGVSVHMVDDNDQPGGQYYRQLPAAFRVASNARLHRDQSRALDALAVLSHPLVTYWPKTTLWAMPQPREFSYARNGSTGRLHARTMILATGAYDRPAPFPGWTLPGVVSAGGCLNLIKGQGILPGRRVALAGNGPLLLVAAYSLIRAGAKVVAIAEAATTGVMMRQIAGLTSAPALLGLGLKYRARILAAGVPMLSGYAAAGAGGIQRIDKVSLAPVGSDGRLLVAQTRNFDVDALVTGYGLSPSTEFARMIGCAMHFDPLLGGWVPQRSAALETSIQGIFGAGDGCGIGGVEVATAEGRVAARAVADRLGVTHDRQHVTAGRGLDRLNRFRCALSAAYELKAELQLADDETVICRCEDVTRGRVRAAAREFGGDLRRIKSATRVSMGSCQGRNCLSSCASIVAKECAIPLQSLPPQRMRSPARPIPLASFLGETLGPPRAPVASDSMAPHA